MELETIFAKKSRVDAFKQISNLSFLFETIVDKDPQHNLGFVLYFVVDMLLNQN